MNEQIAFVASTLPVQFIYKKRDELNINKIIISAKMFEESYKYLQDKLPFVKLSVVPNNLIIHFCYLAYRITLAKLTTKEIIFFHECGWPIFDLLVKVIKPKGLYSPQVKLTSFSAVIDEKKEPQRGFKKNLFKWIFKKYFMLYKGKEDGGENYYYVWSARNYPASIKVSNGHYSFIATEGKIPDKAEKRILFLLGREPVQDDRLISIFDSIGKIAQKKGYEIVIKDHPRPAARLNFKPDGCRIIDPAQPVELLDEVFDYVVGVASTGLIAFPNKAISVINLLDEMSPTDKEKRISHLVNLSGKDKLIFLNSTEEFESYLICDVKGIHASDG
ncbi:MAG: hypothetical protein JW902_15630 [Syntrophaceae bacterium]|nr:hypothetical protein [Syntrophaceae bacterium]